METELKLRFKDPSRAKNFFEEAHIIQLLMPESKRITMMHSLYYDTAEGDLNKSRATLRVRQEGDQSVMTIKLGEKGSASLHQRLEWNLVIDEKIWQPDLDEGIDSQNFLKYAVSDGDPDESLLELLERIENKPLQIICQAHFQRTAYDVGYGDTLMELALDDGYLTGGDIKEPLLELELELKEGDVPDLLELGLILEENLPLEPEPKSKYARCLDLLAANRPANKGI